jgi:hypothetical protein
MMRLSLVILLAATLPLTALAKPAKRKLPRRPTVSSPSPSPSPSSSSSSSSSSSPSSSDEIVDDAPPASSTLAQAAAPDAGSKPAPPPKSAPAKPEPAEPKESAPPAAAPAPDLAKLRADYDRLRDELYRARARAQVVQEGLYQSKLGATLRWKGAPDYVIRRAEMRLDGASLWESGDKPVNDDLIRVSERPIKPGPHAITVRLEIRAVAAAKKAGKDSTELGYVTEQTFAIVVPDGKRTTVAITGDEDGDPPDYEPQIEVEIESEK